MNRTVHFRGSEIPVSEEDYRSLAVIGCEAAARFFSHLDSEAAAGAKELRGAPRGQAKGNADTVVSAKKQKAEALHDVISAMRKARGQPT